MALITCPECGGKVSDEATTCPHCGYPLSPSSKKEEKNETGETLGERITEGDHHVVIRRSTSIRKKFIAGEITMCLQ